MYDRSWQMQGQWGCGLVCNAGTERHKTATNEPNLTMRENAERVSRGRAPFGRAHKRSGRIRGINPLIRDCAVAFRITKKDLHPLPHDRDSGVVPSGSPKRFFQAVLVL